MALIYWDIYEVTSATSNLNGVMLRGRLRKLGIANNLNVLVENTEDEENGVRFAVFSGESADLFITYLKRTIPDVAVSKTLENVPNPVISKLKVNIEERYKL